MQNKIEIILVQGIRPLKIIITCTQFPNGFRHNVLSGIFDKRPLDS